MNQKARKALLSELEGLHKELLSISKDKELQLAGDDYVSAIKSEIAKAVAQVDSLKQEDAKRQTDIKKQKEFEAKKKAKKEAQRKKEEEARKVKQDQEKPKEEQQEDEAPETLYKKEFGDEDNNLTVGLDKEGGVILEGKKTMESDSGKLDVAFDQDGIKELNVEQGDEKEGGKISGTINEDGASISLSKETKKGDKVDVNVGVDKDGNLQGDFSLQSGDKQLGVSSDGKVNFGVGDDDSDQKLSGEFDLTTGEGEINASKKYGENTEVSATIANDRIAAALSHKWDFFDVEDKPLVKVQTPVGVGIGVYFSASLKAELDAKGEVNGDGAAVEVGGKLTGSVGLSCDVILGEILSVGLDATLVANAKVDGAVGWDHAKQDAYVKITSGGKLNGELSARIGLTREIEDILEHFDIELGPPFVNDIPLGNTELLVFDGFGYEGSLNKGGKLTSEPEFHKGAGIIAFEKKVGEILEYVDKFIEPFREAYRKGVQVVEGVEYLSEQVSSSLVHVNAYIREKQTGKTTYMYGEEIHFNLHTSVTNKNLSWSDYKFKLHSELRFEGQLVDDISPKKFTVDDSGGVRWYPFYQTVGGNDMSRKAMKSLMRKYNKTYIEKMPFILKSWIYVDGEREQLGDRVIKIKFPADFDFSVFEMTEEEKEADDLREELIEKHGKLGETISGIVK